MKYIINVYEKLRYTLPNISYKIKTRLAFINCWYHQDKDDKVEGKHQAKQERRNGKKENQRYITRDTKFLSPAWQVINVTPRDLGLKVTTYHPNNVFHNNINTRIRLEPSCHIGYLTHYTNVEQ